MKSQCENILDHECFANIYDDNVHELVSDDQMVITIASKDTGTIVSIAKDVNVEATSLYTFNWEEDFIKHVQDRPPLYNLGLSLFKRTNAKKIHLWNEISNIYGGQFTPAELQKKWKYLRDCYDNVADLGWFLRFHAFVKTTGENLIIESTLEHNHEKQPNHLLTRQVLSQSVKRAAVDNPTEKPMKLISQELYKSDLESVTTHNITRSRKHAYHARTSILCKLHKNVQEFQEMIEGNEWAPQGVGPGAIAPPGAMVATALVETVRNATDKRKMLTKLLRKERNAKDPGSQIHFEDYDYAFRTEEAAITRVFCELLI
ncbi:unnamed protein product [Ceutorhynchus assimilis]|uniref:MADF domain-containing protein n=1 Tax=Ceutorhynchus assimilis TaxID=467358 RepID=A0A9N9MXP7_9CUCU|nr:unnamed protein product [Ceutorhynchus assimilis]